MHARTLALIIAAAAIGAGCASKESKPEPTAAPTATSTPAQTAAATTVASKPECPPEPTAKKKTAKTKAGKKAATPTVDCEPAKSKAGASAAKTAEPVAAAPASKEAGEAGKPRIVKSRDGTFDGEVYGNIPPNSKWAKLQIGMHQSEVERILGVTSNIRGYVTAKAWIPFYFGTDSHRYEAVYAGQGSVAYTGGGMGGGQGVLMMINYDPKMQ